MVKTKSQIIAEARERYERTQCSLIGCCGDLQAALDYAFEEARQVGRQIEQERQSTQVRELLEAITEWRNARVLIADESSTEDIELGWYVDRLLERGK